MVSVNSFNFQVCYIMFGLWIVGMLIFITRYFGFERKAEGSPITSTPMTLKSSLRRTISAPANENNDAAAAAAGGGGDILPRRPEAVAFETINKRTDNNLFRDIGSENEATWKNAVEDGAAGAQARAHAPDVEASAGADAASNAATDAAAAASTDAAAAMRRRLQGAAQAQGHQAPAVKNGGWLEPNPEGPFGAVAPLGLNAEAPPTLASFDGEASIPDGEASSPDGEASSPASSSSPLVVTPTQTRLEHLHVLRPPEMFASGVGTQKSPKSSGLASQNGALLSDSDINSRNSSITPNSGFAQSLLRQAYAAARDKVREPRTCAACDVWQGGDGDVATVPFLPCPLINYHLYLSLSIDGVCRLATLPPGAVP
jgi:hypothetical protein